MGLIIAPLVFVALMGALGYFGTRPVKKKS